MPARFSQAASSLLTRNRGRKRWPIVEMVPIIGMGLLELQPSPVGTDHRRFLW